MINKILMVDDSEVALKILKRCLPTDKEYECVTASDGAEGVEAYKSEKPDLTFLDLTMPVMDGIEALEIIMNYDADAMVIVCTADSQKKVYDKVMSLGAFMMIKKPPSKESIKAAMMQVLQRLKESLRNNESSL